MRGFGGSVHESPPVLVRRASCRVLSGHCGAHERKARKGWWLLRRGELWAESPVRVGVYRRVFPTCRSPAAYAYTTPARRRPTPGYGRAAGLPGPVRSGGVRSLEGTGLDVSGWWPALAVVAALALVAALVDGRARARGARKRQSARFWPRARARDRTRPGGRPSRVAAPGGAAAPRAREIWWALVPYEDGPGAKDRPCLVLSVRGGTAHVVKITSRHRPDRPGVLPLPPGAVGDGRRRASFLETNERRDVPLRDFRRRAGTVDDALWKRVRRHTER